MYYEVYGSGNTPLVLLHGGGSTIQTSFNNILPFLSAEREVIAVELQAHGRTSDRDAPETFIQDADDVAALLKYLEIEKANFFGFSNGGTTVLQIAMRHPHLVNKIIDLAGATKRDGFVPGFFDRFSQVSLNDMPLVYHEEFLKLTPNRARLQAMFEKDVARMKNFADIPDDDIRAIKAEALIIINDKDVVTAEHTVELSKLIPGGQLLIMPGFHGECIGELLTAKPGSKMAEITAGLINEFLK